MKRVIVFDLGGTLMEYVGMPHSWISYYEECFQAVNDKYSLNLTQEDLCRSVEILKEYNPRYKSREIEYPSEFLFKAATKHWNTSLSPEEIIQAFFRGMKLTAKIYEDTVPVVTGLKKSGFLTAALTNLPSAMPDIHDLVFVGDEKLDIETAKNAACTSVFICRNGESNNFSQDYTIRNLSELEGILSRLSV